MSFKFQKRINLSKGFGLNVSKSGISPSLRTKRGTISTKGISVKTGISGVSYRKSFGKSGSGCLLLVLVLIGMPALIIILTE